MVDDPLVSVRGEAVLEVEPETAQLTVVVVARDKHRDDTLRRIDDRQRAVRALLDSYGEAVESVETSGLRLSPEFKDHAKPNERVVGYVAVVRNTVLVNDFDRLGDLVARLAEQELVEVSGPFWALRRTSPVYRAARIAAAREAVRRARDYAEALGSRLVTVVELADTGLLADAAESGGGWPGAAVPAAAPMRAFAAHAAPEPVTLDLDPARQFVRATVEARFRMEPASLDDL